MTHYTRHCVLPIVICLSLLLVTGSRAEKKAAPAKTPPPGAWSALGSGITGAAVNDLDVHGSLLIAAGGFTQAGGQPANNIAAWDGTAWSPLGSGVDGGVVAIASHEGRVFAVGAFNNAGGNPANHAAVWDGTTWSALGTGLRGATAGIVSFKGEVYAARTEAFPPFGVQRAYVERWNEAGNFWVTVAEFAPAYGSDFIVIRAFDVVGDLLCVGGDMGSILEVGPTWGYDGTGWTYFGPANVTVWAFEQYGGELLAGGYDVLIEKHVSPQTWVPFDDWDAACGWTFDMHVYNGLLVVAGRVVGPDCMLDPHLNTWDGSNWSTLGTGMNNDVVVLAEYNGHLIAGGKFTTADGNPAGLIAQWNEPVATRSMTLGAFKALYGNKR